MSIATGFATVAISAAGNRQHRRFRNALVEPALVQQQLLTSLVHSNAATAFGEEHRFGAVKSWDDYREQVPLRRYDDFVPYIRRIEAHGGAVLTAAPVRRFEPSGGSSGPAKHIPYNDSLTAEFGAAVIPWLRDLLCDNPSMRRGRSYWAISPPASATTETASGIPIGSGSDASYFPRHLRRLISTTLAVSTLSSDDVEEWRFDTVRQLLDTPDLAFISVWNPTFLTLLADSLDTNWTALRAEVRLRQLPAAPPTDLGSVWPHLSLISCWTGGHAGRALSGMRRRFPYVPVQPKGLLATEGVVSVPVVGQPHPVAAVSSHAMEFLEDGDPERARLLHELVRGGTYEVVLSTGGGLYRYRLGDLVEVRGFIGATPLLEFVGRPDSRVDLVGEKLTAALVEAAVDAAAAVSGVDLAFALVAPATDGRGYVLWAEPLREHGFGALHRLALEVEAGLVAAHHYGLARRLGQLRPIEVRGLVGADRQWEARCIARGQRSGDIKPPVLLGEPFEVEHGYVDAS